MAICIDVSDSISITYFNFDGTSDLFGPSSVNYIAVSLFRRHFTCPNGLLKNFFAGIFSISVNIEF